MLAQAGKEITEKVKTHLDLLDCSANVGSVVSEASASEADTCRRNRVVPVQESKSKEQETRR